jgi:hypothetical protein
MSTCITEGTRVRVVLRPDCAADPAHRLAGDGLHGVVTSVSQPGDHSLFVLYRGGRTVTPGTYLPLGRRYRPDELEVIGEPA